MKTLLDKLIINYPYFAAVILFLIGAFTVANTGIPTDTL
jgi:hypothetical protein